MQLEKKRNSYTQELQTKKGNPKVPRYFDVSQWVLEWISTQKVENVQKAFRLCGLVARSSFSEAALHPPLRDLIGSTMDMHDWYMHYHHLIDDDDDREEVILHPPTWYVPEEIESSLFCCLQHSLASSVDGYIDFLADFMEGLEDLDGLLDEDYITALRQGETDTGELILFAASRLHCCNIEVKTLNDDCRVMSTYTYEVPDATRTICIARIGPYFAVKVDGIHI